MTTDPAIDEWAGNYQDANDISPSFRVQFISHGTFRFGTNSGRLVAYSSSSWARRIIAVLFVAVPVWWFLIPHRCTWSGEH